MNVPIEKLENLPDRLSHVNLIQYIEIGLNYVHVRKGAVLMRGSFGIRSPSLNCDDIHRKKGRNPQQGYSGPPPRKLDNNYHSFAPTPDNTPCKLCHLK